jgi:hypothetical protein
MIGFLLGIVLTVVAIAGALPEAGQRELERRIGWWDPRFMGLISSFVEAFFGLGLMRSVLFRHELHVLTTGRAITFGTIGFFLLAEGLVRLGVTMKLHGPALPSIPASLAFKGLNGLAGRHEKGI